MSTTFKVVNTNVEGYCKHCDRGAESYEVAHRRGVGGGESEITWTNELAKALPNNTKVIAVDNSQQGIYTIGDIKGHIRRYESLEWDKENEDV
tara:strand:+ start:928 stop:1206 length:279 start_codon:yes stop_codon:yes gene_type:complete